MKKEYSTKTLLLIFAVVIIWGAVSWQLYSNFSSDDEILQGPEIAILKANDSLSVSGYELYADYSDPFLGRPAVAVSGNKKKQEMAAANAVVKSPSRVIIDFSKFSYTGSYFNKRLNTLLAVIIVSGNEYISKKGDIVDGLLLETILPDSVRLNNQGQTVWIKKAR